jgi:hypothetical protein
MGHYGQRGFSLGRIQGYGEFHAPSGREKPRRHSQRGAKTRAARGMRRGRTRR